MDTLIKNVRLVCSKGIFDDSSVYIKDGIISDVYLSEKAPEKGCRIIDGEGNYLSAGFIDIHVHGGGGFDFMDGTEEAFEGALRAHMKHGTTSMVATSLASTYEELFSFFSLSEKIREKSSGSRARLLGVHLEGPFINPEMAGAQDPEYIRDPSGGSWKYILGSSKDQIRIWTIAPEIGGTEELCAEALKKGIVLSAGHSSCTYEDVKKAIDEGFTMATHLYSSMSTITRKNGYRILGLTEGSLVRDEICAEIIADGIHLPPELLKLIYRAKGPERLVLITDAMRAAGEADGIYKLGSLEKGQDVKVYGGIAHMMDEKSFAGSVATADRLIRVMTKDVGVPLNKAVCMMTENPAREIREEKLGRVEKGFLADLVIFDEDINIKKVFISGNEAPL